jgi:GTP cyclohydrolase II
MARMVREVARVKLPTALGTFEARAFECPSGLVYLALIAGKVGDGEDVLTRLHSECLTGDVLASLRCDCGIQLRTALRAIAAEGRGVLIYLTGQEGRGIGLVNKLRAYVEQDLGADTVDANLHLGFPADARDYRDAGEVLRALGVRSVRLMTNNPAKVEGLEKGGIVVQGMLPLHVAAHARNLSYLVTKQHRMGHLQPSGNGVGPAAHLTPDVTALLGAMRSSEQRPFVVVKYAQSIDGRIATSSGDSKWISGEEERAVSHALRARCDAIMIGAGTVLADDPQLTVRLVHGASPLRVVADSTLRISAEARVLDDEAASVVITTERSDPEKRDRLRARGVAVRMVRPGPGGIHLPSALRMLKGMGVDSLLVEGGARLVTSLLAHELADRLVVAIAPLILGEGTQSVGDLGIGSIREGLRLGHPSMHSVGDDVLLAWDVERENEAVDEVRAAARR